MAAAMSFFFGNAIPFYYLFLESRTVWTWEWSRPGEPECFPAVEATMQDACAMKNALTSENL